MTDPTDPLEGLDVPDTWPDRVRDVVSEVLDESPDLAGAALGTLFAAADLLTTAEALDAVSRAAGHVAEGSKGQPIAHPAGVEARLSRVAAAAILRGLRPDAPGRRTEQARRAARARHGTRRG